MNEHSPLPWRVERNSGMFEIFGSAGYAPGPFSPTPKPPLVCSVFSEADAAFIVEAVNANGAWREERRRLQLEAAGAEKAFENADARRTLLERYYCEVCADRDRLRDLVRRLVESLECAAGALLLANITQRAAITQPEPPRRYLHGVDIDALLREAREAIGEDKQEGDGKC